MSSDEKTVTHGKSGIHLRLYARIICYRFRKQLVYPLASPSFVRHQKLSFEDIQGKHDAQGISLNPKMTRNFPL